MRSIGALAMVWGVLGVPALAQAPIIGDINFYGLRKVTPEKILHALKLHAGDPLPGSKEDMEERMDQIPGVVLSRVEAVCCDGTKTILFIGIEERLAPHAAFRSDPAGDVVLPAELVDTYQSFLSAVQSAAAEGHSGEDLSAGYSMMDDPRAWAFQKRFLALVPENLKVLREVLHNGSEPNQRAIAAALIGYEPDKAEAIDELQYALQDPDEAVRANAMRSLTAIAVLASKQPALGLRISPTWLVELLNSVVLSDRVESVKALLALTEQTGSKANPERQAALDLIRERALHSVVEMARWKTPRYALPPFVLASRLAGIPYVDALQQWANGNREAVLAKALGGGGKKPGGTLQ
ncbi:MAG TPA: HEAT repeat domain-containing protein [Bryobacteraceae bacterium]|nr:HEAT repeat domain-containing protein [Bryobacteraceae bacterium]